MTGCSAPLTAGSLQAVLDTVLLLLWAQWLTCGYAGHMGGWATAGSVASGTIVGVSATYRMISRPRRDMDGCSPLQLKVVAAALLAGCLAALLVSTTVIAEVGLWHMDSG